MKKFFFCIFSALTMILAVKAQRVSIPIDSGWKFSLHPASDPFTFKYNDEAWEKVNLPHCWNANDPYDDDDDYYRGIGWYRKTLSLPADKINNKKVQICFDGANQVTDVYVNGAFAGRHNGGYTAFNFDITALLKKDGSANVIAVKVNNAQDPYVAPLDVGYTIYGGIYRHARLLLTEDVHFATHDYGSSGLFVSAPMYTLTQSVVKVKAHVQNESASSRSINLANTLSYHDSLYTFSTSCWLAPHADTVIEMNSDTIRNPALWSPEHPELYTLHTAITENGWILDQLNNAVAFRTYRFTADSGFFLNGKKYFLKGTNRHQDMMGKGSALTQEDHERDLQLIKNMGCNFLRLAHYPQDPYVLQRADELGLLIWEEIPLVNYMNINETFLQNCKTMIKEMIRQHYNHPSVLMWGSMNEIFLNDNFNSRSQKITDTVYGNNVCAYEKQLDQLVREEDSTRFSTIAMHISNDYDRFKIDVIPQVSSYNIYSGWYAGKVEEFGKIFDKKHQEKPDQVIFISEYGAESDLSLNTEHPERLDNTGQYQRYFHEAYLRQIQQRSYLSGAAIWNQFDFGNPNIGGTISNINHKGMYTWDRKSKDIYYLYKANWNPEPMVYIASRNWPVRAIVNGDSTTVEVYSNAPEINLSVNGKSLGKKKTNENHKASWKFKINESSSHLNLQWVAKANFGRKQLFDTFNIQYRVREAVLADTQKIVGAKIPFQLKINCGAQSQYFDSAHDIWVEDKPYAKGDFGYVGGKPSYISLKGKITATDMQPLLYSYLDSIGKYKVDVPDGRYEVELYFAEPELHQEGKRIFDVSLNGEVRFAAVDLFKEKGYCGAVMKKTKVEVLHGEGIVIGFNSIKGKPIINGISIKSVQ